MKWQLFQSLPRNCESGSCLVLIIAFLLLPYLLDVAYYGDLTPTHFAQESPTDAEEDLLGDPTGPPLQADDHTKAGMDTEVSPPVFIGSFFSDRYSPHVTLRRLDVASFVSRPPPAL